MNLSLFRKPARYIGGEINSIQKEASLKIALCFPDVYEIGMSHLGLRILYDIINALPDISAHRVFAPWSDLEDYLRGKSIPLSDLETGTPLSDFDIVGFSLQYELSYTTVLNMLSLGGIPLRSEGRREADPIVIAGGPSTFNPAPITPFFDAILIGDGEEAVVEIAMLLLKFKREGDGKRSSLLKELSKIEGVYVPSIGGVVRRRVIKDLDTAPFPCSPIVPYFEIVHDRITIEASRGCTRGCRFCQAGMIYRPVRERGHERILDIADKSIAESGYGDVSLNSLSIGDYSGLTPLLKRFNRRFGGEKIALSLPSIRVSAVNDELLSEISSVRKSGFTIAPEAATERLRRVINKDYSQQEYENTLYNIFKAGWQGLKLYYMIGLPTETDADIEAIPEMVYNALSLARRDFKKGLKVNIGVSTFIPKPHTPFQWHGQIPISEMGEKSGYLKSRLSKKGITYHSHDPQMSMLEAAISRGDEKIGDVIEAAYLNGARLDAWTECFSLTRWERAMESTGISLTGYAQRRYEPDSTLPWDMVDTGISKDYLRDEYKKAFAGDITLDCKNGCTNCGLDCPPQSSAAQTERVSARTIIRPNRQQTSVRVRMVFSKTERLRYLSHLELIRTMLRALRRAKTPLLYSQGFHPAPEVSFGPPLSVGVAGLKEYMDMDVIPPFDIIRNIGLLNGVMPDGLTVKDLFFIPPNTPSLSKFISGYRYEVRGKRPVNPDDPSILSNLIEYNISEEADGTATLRIFLQDTDKTKVKIANIIRTIYDMDLAELDITRVAMYGMMDGWVEPDEIRGRR